MDVQLGFQGLFMPKNFLQSNQETRCVVIAVESPTATFQKNDFFDVQYCKCRHFGDGAACVLLSSQCMNDGPEILVEEMYHFMK
jgi:predicted naringenin-chalcone synthase